MVNSCCLSCEVCGLTANGVMNWDGQAPIKLCDGCIGKAKKMLDGKYFYLRDIRRQRPLSDQDKKILAKLSSEVFMRPDEIGFSEKQLLGLVMQGLATMTRSDKHMQFKKVIL